MRTRTAFAVGTAVLAGSLLVGCGSSDGSFDASPSSMDGMAGESMPMEDQKAVQVGQQVIQTANTSLEVDDVNTAVANITTEVEAIGGSVQSRSINRFDDDATASMTIRIPAASLETFLASLADQGEVLNTTVDAQDVTVEVIDLEARISSLEASIDRLRELQGQATSVADLVAVEAELATRQSELESLTARRDYLASQVALSTVYLWIDQVDTGAALTPDFLGGLQRGWDALLTLGAGLITAAGFILPTALVGLVVAAVILIIIRLARTRHSRKGQS